MSPGIRLRELLVVAPLAAAALAGAVAAVAGRGADDAFLLRQKNPTRVMTPAVEKLMLTAPAPDVPHNSPGTRARCRTQGRRELRNPWRCTVHFRSGSVARFLVTIRTDGSYRARYLDDTATATGCCLSVPAAE
ncbi:MAG: hypothetical protein ACRDJY_05950 [Thermoleophilaceae bacterium]